LEALLEKRKASEAAQAEGRRKAAIKEIEDRLNAIAARMAQLSDQRTDLARQLRELEGSAEEVAFSNHARYLDEENKLNVQAWAAANGLSMSCAYAWIKANHPDLARSRGGRRAEPATAPA
jgi:predicted site-specific integrase-resolvase